MWDFTCPVCKSDDCVLPVGPKTSSILIIGDYPQDEEVTEGKCFVGPTGGVLRSELAKVGLDMRAFRLTTLWLHKPNKNSLCLEYGIKKALEESVGKKVILLMGSEPTKQFCGVSVKEWNGLQVSSELLPNASVMVSIPSTSVFGNGLGEFRFAMQNFSQLLKEVQHA